MTLRLKIRGGMYHVFGSVRRLADGEVITVRQSTGYAINKKRNAETARARIEYETMHSAPKSKRERVADKTVADAITLYLRQSKPGATTSTNLIRWAGWVGEKTKLIDLEIEKIMAPFDRAMDTERMKPTSAKRYLGDIRAMLNVCRENKWAVVDDLIIKMPVGNDERERWLSPHERDLLIACCDESIADAVTFLFYTGARPGEMYRLRAADVLVATNSIKLFSHKGRGRKKRVRAVPLSGAISEMVFRRAMVAETSDSGLLFPNTEGRKWGASNWASHMRRAVSRAKIEDFRTYDCRSTFASLLVQNGTSLRGVADLLGHTSLAMVMRYAYLAHHNLVDAISTLTPPENAQKRTKNAQHPEMVPPSGIEPLTPALPMTCSTPELRRLSEDSMELIMVPQFLSINKTVPITNGVRDTQGVSKGVIKIK